jgi:hypothetical protein
MPAKPREGFIEQRLREISKGPFHTSLGSFMDLFSAIESVLLFVVQFYAKTDWTVTKAMMSPLRVENAITTLNRIIEARRLRGKKISELKTVLTQLGEINKTRNDILHHGLVKDPKGRDNLYLISNKFIARSPKTVFKIRISKTHIDQMRADLLEIHFRLAIRHVASSAASWSINAKRFRRENPLGTPHSWRYKSPSRGTSRPKRRAHVPKQPHRPKPSSA